MMNRYTPHNQMQEFEKELDNLNRKKEHIQAQWNQIELQRQFPHVQIQPTDFMHPQQIPPGPPPIDENVITYQSPKLNLRPNPNRKRNNQDRFPNKWKPQPEFGPKKRRFLLQTPNEKKKEDYVLHEDGEPSVKLLGRLELGLGHIMKEMRMHFPEPPYDYMFLNSESLKLVKIEVRERIRKAMIGKNVIGLEYLIQSYRAAYPFSGDKELLDKVKARIDRQLEASSAQTADLLIVKNYIGKKLDQMLDDIFGKMTAVCQDPELGVADYSEKLAERKLAQNNGNEENAELEEARQKVVQAKYDATKEQFTELLRSTPMDERKLIKFIRTQLNILLPSYKSYIKKILYEDDDFVKFVMQGRRNENPRDLVTHYVRILGRPVLPDKKMLNDFLQQFNPLHVKRHKTIPNLLFVGVGNNEDLDAILDNHNMKLDDTQLSIRSSQRDPQSDQNSINENEELDELEDATEYFKDDNIDDFCSDMELDCDEDE